MELTERTSIKELETAWWKVEGYTEGAMRPIKNKFNKHINTITRRVRTPEKLLGLYMFAKTRRNPQIMSLAVLLVDGSEGTTMVTKAFGNKGLDSLFMIRSHAVNRYMQRHGFDGTYLQCQEYLLNHLWVNSQNVDTITKDLVVYFDGGVFLGKFKDNTFYLNTYVLNPHLYPNQRMLSKRLQDTIEKVFKDYQKQKK